MKRCPECRRDYYDDSLIYCLDDGTALLEGPASSFGREEPETAILADPSRASEAATRAQISTANIRSSGEIAGPQRRFRTRLAAAVAALVLVLAGGLLGVRYFRAEARPISSIAVMPFVNTSGDPNMEYLSDGVSERLINNLSQLGDLSVKGRSSVFRYKGKDVEPQQVAADLKVQAVLNGRVTQGGDGLTISLDLVDGATGDQIWGQQYTRKAGDLAVLQSEIARDVSQKLRARLTGAEEKSVVKNQTQNTEAYQLYLQGRYNWNKRTDPTNRKAIEYFQEAIEKDPRYAMAYVGLAESYVLSDDPISVAYPKVKAAASRALEIDPTLGEPHAALAAVHALYERDFPAAEKDYERAIELSPNYATAYHWYAEYLMQHGRPEESLTKWKKALGLDPSSLAIGTDYGLEYLFYTRRYDQAIDYLSKLVEMDPNYIRTHTYLAIVYEMMGRYDDVVNERVRSAALSGAAPEKIEERKKHILDAMHTSGAKGYWTKALEFMLHDNKDEPPLHELAVIYTKLGQKDEAFKYLEAAAAEGVGDVEFIQVSPIWDALRDDARYTLLLRKMGFIE